VWPSPVTTTVVVLVAVAVLVTVTVAVCGAPPGGSRLLSESMSSRSA